MAKQRIKINESSLKHIIMETVKRVLKETTDFAQVWGDENYDDMNRVNGVDPSKRRFIEDPSKFAQDLGQKKVSKFNRIQARPAQGKESLVTYKQDPSIAGTGEDNIETTNDFEGGMVANNVNTPWQKYGIDQKTFDKKYEIDPENPSQYRPKGGPMYASQVQDDVAFPNPWGQGHMNVDKGGYMMQDPNNPSDTYGIQKGDYDSTYKEINEEAKQKVRINEEQLKQIVSESVKMILKEYGRADVKSVGGSPLRYGLSSMFGGKYATRMDRRIKSQKDSEAYRAKKEAEAEQERRERGEAEERNRRYREDADRRNREAAEAERRRGSSIGTSADYDAINRGDYGRVNPNIAYSMWRKGQITQNEYYRVCERNGVQPKY